MPVNQAAGLGYRPGFNTTLPSAEKLAQQFASHGREISEVDIAIAVTIQHGAKQPTGVAPALLIHSLCGVAQHLAEHIGIHALLASQFAELTHDDRCQNLHQFAGAVGANSGGLTETDGGPLLPCTEYVLQDGGTLTRAFGARAASTEHAAQQTAQIDIGMVLLQRPVQRLCALGLRGIATHRTQDQRQGGLDRAFCLLGFDPNLAGDGLHRAGIQVAQYRLHDSAHLCLLNAGLREGKIAA